ncbi:MAG: hypothetical protein NVS9B8_09240 [Candidatus Limnocylindrales bacterium]
MASADGEAAAADVPADGGATDVCVDGAVEAPPPPLQAEMTTASTANGAATRRDVFLVVKSDLL